MVELEAAICYFIAVVIFLLLMASILEQKSLRRSGCESLDLHYQLFLIDFEVHRDAGGAV